MQPTGGMDMIVRGLLRAAIPGGRTVRDLVVTESPVVEVVNTATGVRVGHAKGSETADFCVSTMAPSLLAKVKNNFTPAYAGALARIVDAAAFKLGWQATRRFWEQDDEIYGGISWTDHPIRQIWYPSDGFFAGTGVLTGAYNSGPQAEAFGNLSQAQRIEAALRGGEKLHPGFSQKVHADKGLTIAWHLMPHQIGGWAVDTANTQPEIYRQITTLPQCRLYLAGDAWSQLPGWKEGAVTSAYAAVESIAYWMTAGKAKVAR